LFQLLIETDQSKLQLDKPDEPEISAMLRRRIDLAAGWEKPVSVQCNPGAKGNSHLVAQASNKCVIFSFSG
jgi:hypothetical protein